MKDRAALAIVLDAERRGVLRPGGVIVEGTAGNTGIGLALVANARGYRSVIVIPDTQSQEKKDTLRVCGATLHEVPAVPYKNPNNYVHVAQRLAEALAKSEPQGAIWAQQFDNVANRQGHMRHHRPGDLAADRRQGRRIHLRSGHRGHARRGGDGAVPAAIRQIKIGLADPPGAALFSYYTSGELKAEGSSITEGIGQGRITKNLEGLRWTFRIRSPTARRVQTVFDLLLHEGLCLGSSSGINVAGAVAAREAARARPHHRHDAVRLGDALPVAPVQPGVPALQGPAGAGVARAHDAAITARSDGSPLKPRGTAQLLGPRLSCLTGAAAVAEPAARVWSRPDDQAFPL